MPRYRKKLRRYARPPQYIGGGKLGKLIGTGVGAVGGSFLGQPMLGAQLGGMAGGALGSELDQPEEVDPTRYASTSYGSNYAFGGKITTNNQADMLTMQNGGSIPGVTPMREGAKKYNGPKHEQGGVPVDNQGNPTSPQTATAEVEGGETEQDGYIFSDTLKVPKTDGRTFAEVHEMMLKRGADQKDIKKLQMLQEKVQAQEGVQGGDDQPMPEGQARPNDAGSLTRQAQRVANKGATGKNAGQSAAWGMQGYSKPKMKKGGKYGNGGGLGSGYTEEQPLDIEGPGSPSANVSKPGGLMNAPAIGGADSFGGNWLQAAGYAAPSIMKGTMALTNPDVKKTPRVQAETVPVQSSAFNQGKRDLASNYRAILKDPNATQNQKLAAQAQYLQSRSNLAGKEANFRTQQQQFNAQQRSRADRINTQSFQRDRELQAKESGAEKQLLRDAVTDPINAFRKNQAGKRSQIANILTSANQIQNATDRRNAIKRGLRAMGLDEQRIQEIIARNETS